MHIHARENSDNTSWCCPGSQLKLSASMVTFSPGDNAAGLVDNSIDLQTWTQAPFTEITDCSLAPAWVQIDLGRIRSLQSVTFWSFYNGRTYCSISMALSASCMFDGEQIVVFSCTSFDTCPILTASGFTVSFNDTDARCVRWASGRNNENTGVHFLEISISAGQLCI